MPVKVKRKTKATIKKPKKALEPRYDYRLDKINDITYRCAQYIRVLTPPERRKVIKLLQEFIKKEAD